MFEYIALAHIRTDVSMDIQEFANNFVNSTYYDAIEATYGEVEAPIVSGGCMEITAISSDQIPGQISLADILPREDKRLATYLAGRVTGYKEYRQCFAAWEHILTRCGWVVFNPSTLPEGLEYEAYFPLCFAMIDAAKHVHLLPNWKESPGACREMEYALSKGYEVVELEEPTADIERR